MVNIDAVYQKVLAIANKEQRGYVTPLEFNLLANQAQLDIFEQYFYELNQVKRQPSETTTFSDMVELINRKLVDFTSIQTVTGGVNYPANYIVGKIFFNNREVKLVKTNELRNILDSTFHRAGLEEYPIYIESTNVGEDIRVFDNNGHVTTNITCEIINLPDKVEWGYDVIAEKALYNAGRSTNFMHHESEESSLVMKILELAGVILQDQGVIQFGDREETQRIQQEKA
tara:strand:- start:497 stop:1183 length:687 start_codon:yes stop_codon:yes gene_type:complete